MNGETTSTQRDRQVLLGALTPRERDILNLMVADLSNAEIAERLVMTSGTVRWYVKEIYSKLDVHSRDEAIDWAAELISTPSFQAPPPTPTNIPAPTTSLVGRVREIETVRQRLLSKDVRLLTLVGTPGIGKTRLSLEIAATLLSEFSDGVYFVPLAPISDPALVAGAIGGALGIHETGGQSTREMLKHFLREKCLLLVLDNFEHLLPAAPLVGELLAASSRVKVLATSREPLHVYGEQEFPIPPLALPDPTHSEGIETLRENEAVTLFLNRAQAVKPDFKVSLENANAIADICIRLDGLPLAIELAAARVKLHTPDVLLRRLNQRLNTLTGGARDLPERQQTLRGAIAWSYDLLSETEQKLFSRLGVFVGGWSLEAIEAVCSTDLPIDSYDGLESLLNKSLIRQVEGVNGEPRFMMLETLREYALERLAESGEKEAIRQAHANYYLALAEQAEPELYRADQLRWLHRLEEEYGNLRIGLEWFYREDIEACAHFAASLAYFWWVKGNIGERSFWLGRLIEKCIVLSPAMQARILRESGIVALQQGDLNIAQAHLQSSASLCRQLEDRRGLGIAFWDLAEIMMFQGNTGDAISLLEESASLLEEHGNENERATAVTELANLTCIQGDYRRAQMLHEEGLALRRHLGNLRGIASSLSWLGLVAAQLDNLPQAEALLRESVSICRSLGAKHSLAQQLGILGRVMLARLEWEKAEAFFEESIPLLREMNSKRELADNLAGLADAKGQLGECETAHVLLQEGCSFHPLLNSTTLFRLLCSFAYLMIVEGQWKRAACLLSTIDVQSNQLVFPPWTQVRERFKREASHVRVHLDEVTFTSVWAEGTQMTLEQALTYALEVEQT